MPEDDGDLKAILRENVVNQEFYSLSGCLLCVTVTKTHPQIEGLGKYQSRKLHGKMFLEEIITANRKSKLDV